MASMKVLLLAVAFLAFSVYVLIADRQTTFDQFISDHQCSPYPVKTDPVGRKYREYQCADGLDRVGPFYELPKEPVK